MSALYAISFVLYVACASLSAASGNWFGVAGWVCAAINLATVVATSRRGAT